MEYRFKAEEWNSLTSAERVHRCRLLAAESQALADSSPGPELQRRYQKIADEWAKLASKIEQHKP